ncbi:CLUMA_CG010935, isoform A [Clunio marinus]|uniref:CLUMA_CG010935, isoform A n=1 Tax=Clunio marinus TaxID=568069 RepID=A0A1J1IBF8_9DIPT|nr:CLUMA_CG010935, isoform A [Clunio marinus]
MNRNVQNHYHNGSRHQNNASDGITQSDAVSPRFRTDLNNQEVMNFCYSCKSDFIIRSVHDLMDHFSQPHERFSSYCLYCKTGKVHQYRSDTKGLQFYHDCYRSKMNYDK